MGKWPLVALVLSHSLLATPLLAAASIFDHEREFATTGSPGWRSLGIECCHRGREFSEGGLERHTSQGSFWFRQYSSNNDQSTFPPFSNDRFRIHV